ncbi:3' terminal RNA ribose 2'-O-methyltransferase Hen1 [Quadrisphaera sp. INWT6]|uniref:3' terminal RNA ribose 2'-O-methyltransferase Hen1 n=1 Tax=Quadrisphaera sp. INWT6 TaxID=2596917 RepID=UPI0018921A90|nr:3' terminal RNA ribose 2'-O-methyltransferase Hen1 [Quadrisphaera sp. INWT6]MBF5081308.1 3' terminal RNA ribose 2'-O-methyltransferase Hen1 [Quadrisphaera sp. INWT6]
MLLTISAAASPAMPTASDLGFLLHKHPDRAQSTEVFGGTAHVLWPQADEQRATAALLLDVDTAALQRSRGRGSTPEGFALADHVNDRPYAASSLLAVALGKVFRTALAGRCDARPELPGAALPLEVHVPSLVSRGGAALVRRLFEPLGWEVDAAAQPLDPHVPAWGDSRVVDTRLRGTLRLADALSQLYVLLPVLDDAKHYWVSADEVDKLVRAGGDWLPTHPDRDLVMTRYLRHQRSLVRDAVARLDDVEGLPLDTGDGAADKPTATATATGAGRPAPLAVLRREAVLAVLREAGAASVVDLGCGEGGLVRELLRDPRFTRVVGADVSARELDRAARRIGTDRLPDTVAARLELLQTSATYRDERLAGVDAVTLVEVVEHLDPPRLPALERSVFLHARPRTVVVTTPNAEHNVRYPGLAAGAFRHPDHRFEWTRAELAAWAEQVAERHGYAVDLRPVGDDDAEVGPPTQMAVFTRIEEAA